MGIKGWPGLPTIAITHGKNVAGEEDGTIISSTEFYPGSKLFTGDSRLTR